MSAARSRDAMEAAIGVAEEKWLEAWERGPQRTTWTSLPPQVGDEAPDLELTDVSGSAVRLSSFWSAGPALLIFWRHFGCGCGVQRAELLRDEISQYRDAGAQIVVISQGDPLRAAAYAEEHRLDCPILCDSDLEAYGAYGLREGTVAQILFDAPEEFWSHDRSTGEDFMRQRRSSGRPLVDNPWMLPGEFVVDARGRIGHAHRYQHCEDFPEPLVLVSAIKQAND